MTRSDVDKVTDALLHLNRQARHQRGPDGIAEYLARQGFRGVRCESCACPVAEFLADVTGRRVAVGERHWGFEGGALDEGVVPVAVAEFMRRFDDRWYPDLVAGAARTGATA